MLIFIKDIQKDFTEYLRKKVSEKFPEFPIQTISFYKNKDQNWVEEIKSNI